MFSAIRLTRSSFGRQAGLIVIVILVLCFSISAHDGLIEPTETGTVRTCGLMDPPDQPEESIPLIQSKVISLTRKKH